MTLERIQQPHNIGFEGIQVLGEVTRATLEGLEQDFRSERFTLDLLSDDSGRRLPVFPPWVFDYPARFYQQRDQAYEALRTSPHSNLPIWEIVCEELINRRGVKPIPVMLGVRLAPPLDWAASLAEWQRDLYQRLLGAPPTLPRLFLTILTHFLETVQQPEACNGFSPSGYRELLFSSRDPHRVAGLYDPLKVLSNLCDTLQQLWEHRHEAKLAGFTSFRFKGLGLLQGKRASEQRWETILAYCGGRIRGRGKCGFSPLVLGVHDACGQCCKLICPHCGYCSEHCGRRCQYEGAAEDTWDQPY